MSAINELLIGYYKPEQYTTTKIKVYNTDGKECHTSNYPNKLWSNMKKSALAEGKALYYSGEGWKKVDNSVPRLLNCQPKRREPRLSIVRWTAMK